MKFDSGFPRLSTWGSGVATTLSGRWWGFFAAALLLALGCVERVYVGLDLPQRYPEFIVGSIAWTYQNKFHDYAALYSFVAAFVVALALIGSLASRLHRDFGTDGVDRLHELVLLLCAPAALALGALLTTRNDVLWLLLLSDLLLLAALLFAAVLAHRGARYWSGTAEPLFRSLGVLLVFAVVAVFAVPALGIAVNRLGAPMHAAHWMSAAATELWTFFALAAAILTGCFVAWRSFDAATLEARARRMVLAAQLFLPLFFLCLVPPAWIGVDGGTMTAGYPLTWLAKALVVCCVTAGYIDLAARRRVFTRAGNAQGGALSQLSIGCAVGVLLFLKTLPAGMPLLNADDYHFGEMLVPWWSWLTQGLVPFWDYVPARGLVNYLPGFWNNLIFGGTPASVELTYPFTYVAIVAIAAPLLSRVIGRGPAVLALLIGPSANGLGEIDLVGAAFLCCFCWGCTRWRPTRWLPAFAVSAIALLLFAPGQAALTLLACAPLVLVMASRALAEHRLRAIYLFLAFSALLLIMLAVTPLGRMIVGALRYGAEQSAINSVAHGIDWAQSFGRAPGNPWAFELMRASWLIAALWAAVLGFRALFLVNLPARMEVLAFAVPIFIVTLMFVVRAAGRIDEGGSRFAVAGSWALCLLLPLLLFSTAKARAAPLLAWIALAGLVIPYSGGVVRSYDANFDPLQVAALDTKPNIRSLGIARFGSALVEKHHVKRIQAVQATLHAVLEPGETYLDLSGRHALYYYVDRKPPIESGSIYNLVGEKQQLRAIRAIRKAALPAMLLEADNLLFDGGPASLRANLLYRHVLLTPGYQLASVGTQVWLIRDDRVSRLSRLADVSVRPVDATPSGPLSGIFRARDLKFIPASWGRSFASLEKRATSVFKIPPTALSVTNEVVKADAEWFLSTGDNPYLRYDVSAASLAGKDAGLLSFDFRCDDAPDEVPVLGIYWSTPSAPENESSFFALQGQQGRLVIPIDSSPAWLLAQRINTLRFDLEDSTGRCKKFAIRNIELLRRTAAQNAAPSR